MKRILVCILAAVMVLGCLTACGDTGETVSVQKVSQIVSGGSLGLVSRYAGLTVSGETAEITKDENKKVLEVKVEVGDMVKEGDILFSYDTEALELELTKMKLELEGYNNTIAEAEKEIPELERQRDSVAAAQKLSFTLQIQTLQADVREATYNKGVKEREIASIEASLEDTDVRTPIAGRVMSVQDENDASQQMYYDGSMSSNSFITVMDITTYRIKGTINELNRGALNEGMNVLIRSRQDESVTWNGTVQYIDWENQVTNENNMYYYGPTDEMTSSSKYPFYVTLENTEGLILGQHVYIEPDLGQTDEKEGLWLPEYYIVDAESAPYVWASNARGKLEKRSLKLGEYNAEEGTWQIVSGLTEDDLIAFPAEGLSAGMLTEEVDEMNFSAGDMMYEDFGDEVYMDMEGEVYEEEFIGEVYEEEFIDEAMPLETEPIVEEAAPAVVEGEG